MNILKNNNTLKKDREITNKRLYQSYDLESILMLNDAITARTDDQIKLRSKSGHANPSSSNLTADGILTDRMSDQKDFTAIDIVLESFSQNEASNTADGLMLKNWFKSSCVELRKALSSGSHARVLYVIAKSLKDGYLCYINNGGANDTDENALLLRSLIEQIPSDYVSTNAIRNCIAWVIDQLQLSGFEISTDDVLSDAQSLSGTTLMTDLIMIYPPSDALVVYQTICPNYPKLVMNYTSPDAEDRLWR